MFDKIWRSDFMIRLRNWEYWPFGIIQFPVIIYWLFLSVKHRSLVFFSAVNPGIAMGGMFGESKFEILTCIPHSLKPKSLLVDRRSTLDTIVNAMNEAGLVFPVICKPDLGERGYMVKKIHSAAELQSYSEIVRVDFIIQEFIDMPVELGVFYVRIPGGKQGMITSIIGKEMLSVVGDGKKTIGELIQLNDRAKLQWSKLRLKFQKDLNHILPSGQRLELVSIGNHALGTKFLDFSHLSNDQLVRTFDNIASGIKGFYYGRFDLRCPSIADLYEGKIKILELNGCGAEPAHIYQPGFSLLKAMAVLIQHWRLIDKIATENRKRGYTYTSLSDAWCFYKRFKAATSA